MNAGLTVSKHRRHRRGIFRFLNRASVAARLRVHRFFSIAGNTGVAGEVRHAFTNILYFLVSVLRFAGRFFMRIYISAVSVVSVMREPLANTLERLEHSFMVVRSHARELRHSFQVHRPRFIPCLMLLCTTMLVISASLFGVSLEVKLDGKSLGFVESREEMEAIINEVEQKASEYLGTPYSLTPEVTYSLGYVERENMIKPDAVRELLFSEITEISAQYALTVDGEVIGATSSKTSLELLKQRILKARSGNDASVKTEFVQDVRIEQRPVAQGLIKTVDEIEQALTQTKEGERIYIVQSGDTTSSIAARFDIATADIQRLNSSLDIHKIKIGQEIKLSAQKPVLSVKQTKKVTYTEIIPFETITENSVSLFKNQTRIVKQGVNGSASITANVVYIDGVEQSREILNYEIVSQPISAVKQVGTKALPAKSPKGYFILPFRGLRTSLYGWRSRGFHTGLDLAGPTGSPIVAADGGTVTLARWNGGYGYCVIIDHGGGKQTLYGHCSKLLVKAGQRVAQGERIAKVGSTGNSTGPHCHWEVRINGNTVNPVKYLK